MTDASLRTDPVIPRDRAQQIKCVALKMRKSGVVVSMDQPARHHTVIHALAEWAGREITHSEFEQGFLTATGRFMDRERAAVLVGKENPRCLYSEDLW